jgi:hypothetical protein
MKHSFVNSKLTAFAAAVILCCSMLFIQTNARAQCPDATGPAPDPTIPGGCTWNSTSIYANIPGTSCNVTVYYCWRDCPGYGLEVYVYEIDPDMTPDCDAVNPLTLIYDANAIAENAACYNDVQVLACVKGDPKTILTTYVPACWWAVNKPSGGTAFEPCSAEACYCERQCQVCYTGPGYTISNCTTVGAPLCPCYTADAIFPPAGQYDMSTCYTVPCQ